VRVTLCRFKSGRPHFPQLKKKKVRLYTGPFSFCVNSQRLSQILSKIFFYRDTPTQAIHFLSYSFAFSCLKKNIKKVFTRLARDGSIRSRFSMTLAIHITHRREALMIRPTALFVMTALFTTSVQADSTLTLASADIYAYHTPYSPSVQEEPAKKTLSFTTRQVAMSEKQQPLQEDLIRFFYRGQQTIPLTLSRTADIVLQLFDKDGQFVSVIYNGKVSAGKNEIPISWAKLWRGKYSMRVKENRY
jgi:hypothetical protein